MADDSRPPYVYAVVCNHPAPPPTFLTKDEARACIERLTSGPGACGSPHQIITISPPKGWCFAPDGSTD